jgi:hypothetical protein
MDPLLDLKDPYSSIEAALQNLASSTVNFMALISAVLLLLVIGGLGIIGFLAIMQSLLGMSWIEWSSIRRLIGTMVTMGVILGILMGILPTVLSSAGLDQIAGALRLFVYLVLKNLQNLLGVG